jgi:hypothetical protein
MNVRVHSAFNGDGRPIEPSDCVVPILKETEPGRLLLVGTGCYVTRYGLILTAAHVLQDLVEHDSLGGAYVMHQAGESTIHMRRLRSASWLNDFDLGLAQADNFVEKVPQQPLMNMRARLSSRVPPVGEALVTYAYPQNTALDFRDPDAQPVVRAAYYDGTVTEHLTSEQRPRFPYFHIETSVHVRSGASGGPVFDSRGYVIGIASSGWDFGEADDVEPLSSVTLVRDLISLTLPLRLLPADSWEARQLPEHRTDQRWTVQQLIGHGHLNWEALDGSFTPAEAV